MELSSTNKPQIFAILAIAAESRLHLSNKLFSLAESWITKAWASFFNNQSIQRSRYKQGVDGDNDFDEVFRRRNQKVPTSMGHQVQGLQRCYQKEEGLVIVAPIIY